MMAQSSGGAPPNEASWSDADAGKQIGESLKLSGVRKAYGSVVAVEDVSLDVAAGEFVTLLGASGSGKTTTLMIIAGFQATDAGEVRLGDNDITGVPVYKRNLGMVYQNYALFPHMTVADNIAFPLRMRGQPKSKVAGKIAEALEMVQLSGYEKRYPNQLSGGQQQRVALARALVFEPPVLLLDEPLGALDKKLRVEMQREIARIQRTLGITTIYVTHDQEEALTMSDRVVVMNEGQIEQVDVPQRIYERPTNSFVAHFMGATNIFENVAVASRNGGTVSVHTPAGSAMRAVSPAAGTNATRGTLVIRPECVRLGEASEDDWHIRGRVVETTYLGNLHRYRVQLDSGEEIVAMAANDAQTRFSPGDTANVWWPAERGWFIPSAS